MGWFTGWFIGWFARSRPAPRGRRPSSRLRLEALENRVVPAAGGLLWIQQFGTAGADAVTAAATAPDGSLYVLGTTAGTLPGQASAGGTDAYLRKYDAGGAELWTRQFGSASVDNATGIAVDGTGAYVVGATLGTLSGQTSSGGGDVFVRRYDANGDEVWTRQFGTAGAEISGGIALDGAAVYVGGRTNAAFSGYTNAGLTDPFVRKYDLDGVELWARQFGSAANDSVPALAADASGVYVSGLVGAALPGQTHSGGFSDVYVRKYDAGGGELWAREFGPSLSVNNALLTSIGVNATGVYLAASTFGALPGQTDAGGVNDAFVRKYDADGAEMWTRQFGSAGTDVARSVAVDADGVYVAGATDGALPGQTGAGGFDAFVRRYDNGGAEIWARQLGTAGEESIQTVGVAAGASGVYVFGATNGAFPGQTSAGGNDAYVIKLDTGAAPNAPPVNTVPLGTVTGSEGGAIAITGISVADPDAGSAVIQMTLSVGHGTLTVATNVQGGLSAADVGGNGGGAVVLTGTIAQINATLAAAGSLLYTPGSGYSGADMLTVSTSDLGNTGSGGAQTDVDQVSIYVLSTLEQVSALIAKVQADMAAGILTNGQGTSMINSSLKQITETAGLAKIDKFIADVQKLVRQGKLSQANADPLLQAALDIRAGLTS